MVRKTSRKITYLLASNNSHHGHTLGVNSLAVDSNPTSNCDGVLYSAGRDGMIMAWSLQDMNLHSSPYAALDDFDSVPPELNTLHEEQPVAADTTNTTSTTTATSNGNANGTKTKGKSLFKTQVQVHTHWVNDILLANNYNSVISCSSDLTVKAWNTSSNTQTTIGHHHDFVKCLAVDSQSADWVASGGLDRRINLWDLNRADQKLQIDVGQRGQNPKGSVYALGIGGSGGNIIASGGPDSIVRLWDQRSGDSIVDFLGHTDNIRTVLVNKAGNLVLTGSSDATVKLWSVTAGRLLHTLTMHDSSVWSLQSDHPNFEVFHSSDKSGLVIKTDMRGCAEAEDAVCVLVANEHQGVSKIVTAGDNIWTATANSRIHRWRDVDTTPTTLQAQRLQRARRRSSVSFKPQESLLRQATTNTAQPPILVSSIISLNAGGFVIDDDPAPTVKEILTTSTDPEPVRHDPEETIEGQTGLIKHILLNDRRRALTVDTAGEVVLWDLIRCVLVRSYGSRDIQDVADEINTFETMTNWCQVNTRTGQLAVVLEEYYAFDAEVYADEVASELDPSLEFRDDQRINLGRWVIRNLFANLIDAEIKKDADARAAKVRQQRDRGPPGMLSFAHIPAWTDQRVAPTPGLAIGLATPMPTHPGQEDGATPSGVTDYFSAVSSPSQSGNTPTNTTSTDATEPEDVTSPSSLMGRLRSFGKGRLNKAAQLEKSQDSLPSKLEDSATTAATEESKPEPSYDDTLAGVLQKIKAENEDTAGSGMTVSPANETPIIAIPPETAIIISEQRVDAGGTVDLYRGTVASCGDPADVETLEDAAPGWLADFLLLSKTPQKELAKVSFVLQPYDDALPALPNGNARLNAYRMLRGKKILAYVEEKLDSSVKRPANAKPEDWLELFCQGQLIDNGYTLGTIRARIWRSGGDVVLLYRRK
ncbi:hypothetical protein V1512DRAFT_256887 [Lipomyces arxii]|uniref:uncharacterized protein n=1 Tax=Lipomyces arxii TaxID=56418 RepID=UPI0034CE59A8